jgi:membrane protease YdiL (CAAX protease family)
VIIASVAYVMTRVQTQYMERGSKTTATTKPTTRGATSDSDNLDLRLQARLAVGSKAMLPKQSDQDRAKLLKNVDSAAQTPEDKLRAAIVAGEVAGAGEALQRIDEVDAESEEHDDPDIESLQTIYNSGPKDLDPTQRDSLVRRFGWYGKLALVFELGKSDPERKALIEPMRNRVIAVIILALVVLVVGGLGGLVMLVLAIVLALTRVLRSRFVPVPPPAAAPGAVPPVFLESFALYIGAWVLYSAIVHQLVKDPPLALSVLAFLIVPVAMIWPVIRGLRWREARFGFGWHRGGGVLVELVCGFAGYIAGLPLVAAGVAVMLMLNKLVGYHPTHPVQQMFGRGAGVLVMIYLLASVWAPVIEETMFRGALFNHLRSKRWGWLVSSLVVGFIFAAIHPQGWTFIPVLGMLGAIFCWIREWRGSLIAPMTAHALNNTVVVTLGALLLS